MAKYGVEVGTLEIDSNYESYFCTIMKEQETGKLYAIVTDMDEEGVQIRMHEIIYNRIRNSLPCQLKYLSDYLDWEMLLQDQYEKSEEYHFICSMYRIDEATLLAPIESVNDVPFMYYPSIY